jgi:putative ABC transport system permease protein
MMTGRLRHPMRVISARVTQAVATMAGHPLRSGLACLAVAAAVGTVILVVTGLDGVQRYAVEAGARSFGSDSFVIAQVVPGQLSRRELAERLQRNQPIRRADVRFLDNVAGHALLLAPSAQRAADVTAGNRRLEAAAINGTAAALADIRAIDIGDGRFFLRAEEQQAAQVTVIGAEVATTLFPGSDPLGQTVRIGGRGFRVVGVVEPQGTGGGVTLDRYVYIPLQAFERVFGAAGTLQVFARGRSDARRDGAEDIARAGMRARRQLRPGTPDTFDILTPDAARSFVLALSQRIGAAAAPISLMALLAAVIVVTNTSLVSVTQRTREIGVRRALGASRGDVMTEVLLEAALTGLAGGVAGLAIAWAVLSLVETLVPVALPVEAGTAALSLLAAAGAGTLAGWYPARKAARIDVIDALRQE